MSVNIEIKDTVWSVSLQAEKEKTGVRWTLSSMNNDTITYTLTNVKILCRYADNAARVVDILNY